MARHILSIFLGNGQCFIEAATQASGTDGSRSIIWPAYLRMRSRAQNRLTAVGRLEPR